MTRGTPICLGSLQRRPNLFRSLKCYGSRMTLEEINEVADKAARLNLLREFIDRLMQDRTDSDELEADEQRNASRDDAGGMMSRFGKP